MLSSYYLDATHEFGSASILNALGILIISSKVNGSFPLSRNLTFDDAVSNDRTSELRKEHKSKQSIQYIVNEGKIQVDVRDSADTWLRIVLGVGEGLTLPPNLYRKFSCVIDQGGVLHESYQDHEVVHRFSEAKDNISVPVPHNTRELVCELCRQFFQAGWVMGTGGSISIRHGNRIYMTPSGVQKERILPDELYVLDVENNVLGRPLHKPGFAAPKLSDCSPLFLHAFKQRNAGAVLHSHHINVNLVTSMFEGQSEFRISHQEMIKGLVGYGYFDELRIPIIENTAWEHELADSLGEAIANNPKSSAVLVRRHGIYVWGATWEQAKRHAECLHYLFEVAIEMRKLGMDFLSPPKPVLTAADVVEDDSQSHKRARLTENGHSSSCAQSATKGYSSALAKYAHVLLDIEGTTTPITFVKDVLFPYAAEHVSEYLSTTWDSDVTQEDVAALHTQIEEDSKSKEVDLPKPGKLKRSKADVPYLTQYVQWCITKDRKIGALKQLQGHIWSVGYKNGSIKAPVYQDVLNLFSAAKASGVRVSIYSSGSREAQRLLFQYSDHGDLRHYLQSYFDTAVGHKRSSASYRDILLSLGVDQPADVLFVTDIVEEAQAAVEAGLHAVLSVRPGTARLPDTHSFKTVTSFVELL